MNLAEFYIEATVMGFPITVLKTEAETLFRVNRTADIFAIDSNGQKKILPCIIDIFTEDKTGKKTKGSFKGGNSCHKIFSALKLGNRTLGCGQCYCECIKKYENKELQIVKK